MMHKKTIGLLLFLFIAAAGLLTPVARAQEEDFLDTASVRRWKVYQYDAAHARLRTTLPDLVTGGGIRFDFLDTPDTSALLTRHPFYNGEFLGDMTDKSLVAGISVVVTPGTEFMYYGEPHLCTEPADVRFYFETDTHGPVFEETDYWWSTTSPELGSFTSLVMVHPTSVPALWVDAKGHLASSDTAHELAFNEAVRNVKAMGLSFGGGCGFGNGVGIRPGTGSGYFRVAGIVATPVTP